MSAFVIHSTNTSLHQCTATVCRAPCWRWDSPRHPFTNAEAPEFKMLAPGLAQSRGHRRDPSCRVSFMPLPGHRARWMATSVPSHRSWAALPGSLQTPVWELEVWFLVSALPPPRPPPHHPRLLCARTPSLGPHSASLSPLPSRLTWLNSSPGERTHFALVTRNLRGGLGATSAGRGPEAAVCTHPGDYSGLFSSGPSASPSPPSPSGWSCVLSLPASLSHLHPPALPPLVSPRVAGPCASSWPRIPGPTHGHGSSHSPSLSPALPPRICLPASKHNETRHKASSAPWGPLRPPPSRVLAVSPSFPWVPCVPHPVTLAPRPLP